jgi:hypothetical protein
MKEYKNIDELFKDAASGFEPQPSEKVWVGIEEGVFNAGHSKRMVYVKWTLAAILLLLIGVSSLWYFSSEEKQQIIEDTGVKLKMPVDVYEAKVEKETIALKIDKTIEDKSGFKDNAVPIETNITQTEINEVTTSNQEFLILEDSDDKIEMLPANEFTIEQVKPRSIYEIAYLNAEPVEKQITVEEYIEKRKKLHTYTGLGIKPAMVYYPNTEDQFTYTAQADFGIVLNKFYIEAGVGYQQMKERGVYKFNYKSNDSIGFYNKVVSFEIDPLNPDNISFKTGSFFI